MIRIPPIAPNRALGGVRYLKYRREKKDMVLAGLFFVMLLGLLVLHHRKLPIACAGFVFLSAAYAAEHGSGALVAHLSEHHRSHLLLNIFLVIPGFSIVAAAFERCGIVEKITKRVTTVTGLLWVVFFLSIWLDNIAAAMIGGILLADHSRGRRPPFMHLVGIICASNLGGAGSVIGDTTTVMLFMSTDPVISAFEIGKAFFATIPAMAFVCWWVARTKKDSDEGLISAEPESQLDLATEGVLDDIDAIRESAHRAAVDTRWLWLLLGIPGMVVGNVLYDQPALGLWIGLGIGILVSRRMPTMREAAETLPNAWFLLFLVASAELFPTEMVGNLFDGVSKDTVAICMGLLSPWLDNIPLTALCLRLGGFDWALLAYCVGFGGSAAWPGSSASVALGKQYPQVFETKRWFVPFWWVTLTLFVGILAYMSADKVLSMILL